MVCHTSSLETINILRREYRESRYYMQAINKGVIRGNKGVHLNYCKHDKKALKEHADLLKGQFNRGKL